MISAMYSKEYLLYFPTLYVCSLNSMYSSLFSVLEVLLFAFTLILNYVTFALDIYVKLLLLYVFHIIVEYIEKIYKKFYLPFSRVMAFIIY